MAVFFGSDEVNIFCGQPSGGGTPSLQTKSVSYTPSTSAITDTLTPSTGYDGFDEVDVTVSAVPSASFYTLIDNLGYTTENNNRKWKVRAITELDTGEGDVEGWISEGSYAGETKTYNAVPSGTTIIPSTSSQTIGGANYMMESAVTVSAMQSGTAGTPTASKGTVNNHAISVTPKVTNTTGYITGSTLTGTAVTVSASELVSGDKSITANGNNIDVANYSTVSVNVSGGGGGSVQVDEIDADDLDSASATITISGLQGEPTSFILWHDGDLATGASPFKVACVVFDGTDLHGQTITNTNNAQVTYDGSSFSKSYNNGTLTITSSGAYFQAGDPSYVLTYTYDGTAGNIKTADVQVGSGATSITFTDLEDEPIAWYLIFKSNFSTSSGYQRVIWVEYDGNLVGMSMDSSAHTSSNWTSSYNNGTLTITSQGTNAGGYFHQPGYYQLTYVVADASPYEIKSATYRASTSAQTDKIEPSSGYDAMSEVNISIPAVTQTNLTADNIKSGTTVSISNGQSNLWSVTGTYGGGGTSKNVQVVQGSTRTSSATATAIGAELTVSKAGTYDVYWGGVRTSTSGSYTYGTQLYIAGSAYGSENTTWTNHVQTNHLSNVSLTANQKIRVYGRNSRGSSYYIYAPQLTIVEA